MTVQNVNGVPVHYVEHGSGIPVFVLHGLYVDHQEPLAVFEPIFADRDGYRRIYVDLPGMGRTPASDTLNSMDDVLNLLLGLVDALAGGEPFLLIAHSYGGLLARSIAKQRPEQTAGLALFCPVVNGERPDLHAAEHVVQQDSGDLAGLLEPELEKEFRGYFVVQTRATLKRFQDAVMPGMALVDHAGLERIFGNAVLHPSPDDLPAFTKPTLLVTGRFDSTVGYVDQQSLIEQYPRGTFVVLDGAGHALPHEQPTLVNALVDEWLDRVKSSG